MLHKKHLIAGKWIASDEQFANSPVSGKVDNFAVGKPEHIARAVEAAERAFASYGYSSRSRRAKFLRTLAEEIEALGDEITEIASRETGLPKVRLQGERGRTIGQFHMFATYIEKGEYLDIRHVSPLPDRQPLPRPDLHLIQMPIGPVAVFGASNFPLAFSTAGGDTASALAAGCPVVVKGHPAHPGTSELVARSIVTAIEKCSLHPGVFSLVQGGTLQSGQDLVQHPLICAVGFTGSLGGGRALFDLCAKREMPIPFFGELGSTNPIFLLPNAINVRGEEIAKGWANSLVMGAGQFCTNPGIAVVIGGEQADSFIKTAAEALGKTQAQTMLTNGIAKAYCDGRDQIAGAKGVSEVLASSAEPRTATPHLYQVSASDWLQNPQLGEEVFGPLGLVVIVKDMEEMLEIAKNLKGQLTCTLHMEDEDISSAQRLMPILMRKAGRVLANGFPTGVEVADAMVHGGPYPASTNFGHTAVGTMAIRRWLRPVCFQDIPAQLLPRAFSG